MGQYWELFNLTRGTHTNCGGIQMAEFAPCRALHANLAAALRPGGAWSGHRLVLSGDYDTNRSHVAAYLRAHGLAVAQKTKRVASLYSAASPSQVEWPPKNLYTLISNGPLSRTSDTKLLRWMSQQQLVTNAYECITRNAHLVGTFSDGDFGAALWVARRADAQRAELYTLAARAERFSAVSHDARQRVLLMDDELAWVAFICLLAESSGAGNGDIEAHFRGDWAAHSVAVLPEAKALGLGYEDVTALLLTPQWLRYLRGEYHPDFFTQAAE